MTKPHSLLLALLALVAHGATAAEVAPPSCTAPERPEKIENIPQYNAFARAATAYRKCLMDYAEAQQAISETHSNAANAAIEQWNAFARTTGRDKPEEKPEQKSGEQPST